MLVTVLVGVGAPVWAQKDGLQGFTDPSKHHLEIESQGYFFVGGEYFTAADGQQYMANQMYVEYQIPKQLKHKFPIVLIHGGGLTGTYRGRG